MKHRKISSVMTPAADVISVHVDTPYKEIASLLAAHNISAVPVLDPRSQVVGVVSEADLMYKESRSEPHKAPLFAGHGEQAAEAKATGTTALELMTSPAVTITADADVVHAARLMEKRRVKRLPVVDADDHLVGIVSRHDIVGLFLRSDADLRTEIIDDVLVHALWVDPAQVDVTVDEGVVTLGGQVDTLSLAGLIVHLTRRVDGVVEVVDQLGYARDDSEDRVPGSNLHGVLDRDRPR